MSTWTRRWRSLTLMVGTAYSTAPLHTILYFGSAVTQSVAGLGFAYALKVLIDAGADGDAGRGVGTMRVVDDIYRAAGLDPR